MGKEQDVEHQAGGTGAIPDKNSKAGPMSLACILELSHSDSG